MLAVGNQQCFTNCLSDCTLAINHIRRTLDGRNWQSANDGSYAFDGYSLLHQLNTVFVITWFKFLTFYALNLFNSYIIMR